MWKKISNIDALLGVHEGDIISQNPFTTFFEFVILTIEQEYLTVLHSNRNGKWTELLFHRNHLYIDNWWFKKAGLLPSLQLKPENYVGKN
jgi:hypothetical protein